VFPRIISSEIGELRVNTGPGDGDQNDPLLKQQQIHATRSGVKHCKRCGAPLGPGAVTRFGDCPAYEVYVCAACDFIGWVAVSLGGSKAKVSEKNPEAPHPSAPIRAFASNESARYVSGLFEERTGLFILAAAILAVLLLLAGSQFVELVTPGELQPGYLGTRLHPSR
jgi:hypothetical protein